MKHFEKSKKQSFIVFTVLLILTSLVTFFTYLNRHHTSSSPFVDWAVRNHFLIMVILLFIAVGFGFFWSRMTTTEIIKSKRSSKEILDLLFLFLHHDEKAIVDFLVKEGGETSQAEISRLEGMNRVKAFRSLQKLEEKDLVQVTPHGKIRRIKLNKQILDMLKGE